MARAYYSNDFENFGKDHPDQILGEMTRHHSFSLDELQRNAWLSEISILKKILPALPRGRIFFEFAIPRMGKRADVILLIKGILFVLEFKVGENSYPAYAIDQVMDYALDLKNFHVTSHNLSIVPILISTQARTNSNLLEQYDDGIFPVQLANENNLHSILENILENTPSEDLDPLFWYEGSYKPTPTIIEAAQALYSGHSVHEISRSDAGAINLTRTASCISNIIARTKDNREKAICFITGVPGAGKTLVGLNLTSEHNRNNLGEAAVFLSGNGPLVKVLREALVRDEIARELANGNRVTRSRIEIKVRPFIQNIHHFRDDALISNNPPNERIAIFDEAQRAWDLSHTAQFMKTKKRISEFNQSEPDFLISIMDRHTDWAVIVCLVGGGQEIHDGEGGLLEWFRALENHFPKWKIYSSNEIQTNEYLQGISLRDLALADRLSIEKDLHLSISVRSFRSESLSGFVQALLSNQTQEAKGFLHSLNKKYPIVITRNLEYAKAWLRQKARGSERFGLLASSGALRLKPLGIYVDSSIDVEKWFLNDKCDVRSSFYLEGIATEFDIQGLELDWTGVIWDADLRYVDGQWQFRNFKGTKWQSVNDEMKKRYLINTYRVLLTRARQGLVIVIPHGNSTDPTRTPEYYDGVYGFLKEIGLRDIEPSSV